MLFWSWFYGIKTLGDILFLSLYFQKNFAAYQCFEYTSMSTQLDKSHVYVAMSYLIGGNKNRTAIEIVFY